jgi:hypothetical protein
MELRLLQPKIITQLFEVLKENTTDNLIHFHPDSIKLRATDTSKTSITYVSLWGNSLDYYKCSRYQPVGVSIPKLWSTFKIANFDDVLEMKFQEGHEGTLDINIIDNHTKQSKFNTDFITYDYEEDGLSGIPENLEIGSCISMDSQRFYEDLKKLESLESEYVRLRQYVLPNGSNRLQLIGLGSQCHRNPTINIDEMITKNHHNKAPVTPKPAPPAPIKSQGAAKPSAPAPSTPSVVAPAPSAPSATAPAPSAPAVVAPSVQGGSADKSKQLEELDLCFPLKKLVHFTKAHCLDDKVALHLNSRGFLVLQYHIKIYGELRFVIMATAEDEEDDLAEDGDSSSGGEEEEEAVATTANDNGPKKGTKRERERGTDPE